MMEPINRKLVTVSLMVSLVVFSCSVEEEEKEIILDANTEMLVGILKDELQPLPVDPLSWSDEDLRFLDPIAEKNVIGLGEASHGTAEFFDAKHRIFRYLVENHGYKVFAFEADFGESLFIDEAIQQGNADAILDLMKFKMHFWTWRTEEVQELLEWMCRYNQDKSDAEKVHYMGVDCQFNTYHPEMVRDFLHGKGLPFIAFADSILEIAQTESLNNFDTYKIWSLAPFLGQLAALKDSMDLYREEIVGSSSEKEFQLISRVLEVTKQVCEVRFHRLSENAHYAITTNYRDMYMAENTAWIREYLGHQKIALWAHNSHIANGGYRNSYSMGEYLNSSMADEYTTIGFLFSRGEVTAMKIVGEEEYGELEAHEMNSDPKKNSLNALMSHTGEPAFHIEMTKL
ncbi:MAG: erythromycin esterase family protein, partial [Bacteroidota bacterium]